MKILTIASLALALFAAPVADASDLKPFVGGSWQSLVKAHAGSPIVVHFWGLTCPPCLVELPRWTDLQRERPEMTLVMVAADPAPADEAVQARVLGKAGLGATESWTFADAFSEKLRHEVDPKWRGELPRTILIGPDGTQTALVGPVDSHAIRNWFDAARAKKPPVVKP